MLLRTIQKLFLITMLALGSNANALVINFDSLNGSGPITNGYSGLNWSNFYFLRGSDIPNTGYAAGVVSSRILPSMPTETLLHFHLLRNLI